MARIVSLLPSATEVIFALQAQDLLCGITHECDFPPEAAGLPVVTSAQISPRMPSADIDALVRSQLQDSGTLYALDMELVRGLRPDLVLTQQLCTVCAVGYQTVQVAMATLPGPPTVVNIEPESLQQVLQSFITIGRYTGREDRALELTENIRDRLKSIPPVEPAPKVLFLEWLIPPFSAGHWIPELVSAAGGIPVLGNLHRPSRGLDWEKINNTDFDVLAISCCGFAVDRTLKDVVTCSELDTLRGRRPGLRVILLDGNHYFSRPGPRIADSAELLNRALRGQNSESSKTAAVTHFMELDS